VYEFNSKIVGYIYGTVNQPKSIHLDLPKTGVLEDLAVLKEFRGRKIASELWRELKKWFKNEKCKAIQLQVINGNPADQIYEKWGFDLVLKKMRLRL
jgi:ribosomal protein S18 acetylase RimI-like enzyme